MQIPVTLQERVRILSTKSAEALKKAGAYTIISVPKLIMIGGGVAIGYGLATGNYGGALGGAGLAGLGWMADYSIWKRALDMSQDSGVVVYRLDERDTATIDDTVK